MAKGFLTFFALVGLLPCMDSLVHHQAGLPAEALPTFYTLKHSHSRVRSHVVQEPGTPLKALPTFCTLVGFLFCGCFLAISNEDGFSGASFLVRGVITGFLLLPLQTGWPLVWAVGFW